MIRYTLECDAGHRFEGWFRSSSDFDAQASRGLVSCPNCGSVKCGKALMAPSLHGIDAPEPKAEPAAPVPVAAAGPAMPAEMRKALKALRDHVTANSEDVGERFAEEARKIHHEETEARAIRGQATLEEVRALHEEGVPVAPLPVFPEDLS